jgi:LEA14-like dessication related protein
MKIATLFISMISVLIGCSSMKKVIEPPKVKLQEIHISKLSALHTDLEIILSVKNPNNINFDVKNLKYSLDINDKTVTSGTLKEKVIVKAKETTMVSVPLRVQYKDILSSVFLLLQKDGVPYFVKGSVEVGPFTIPFDDKGNLKSDDL